MGRGGDSSETLDLAPVERFALGVYSDEEPPIAVPATDRPDCYLFFGELDDAFAWADLFEKRRKEPGFSWPELIQYEVKDDWNVWIWVNGPDEATVARDVLDRTFTMKLPLFREHEVNEHWW